MSETAPDSAAERYLTVVCARPNHPEGYGACNCDKHRHGNHGTAHGYVLLFVKDCRPEDIDPVCDYLNRNDVRWPFGKPWAEWYGGRFDPLAVLQGDPWNAQWPAANAALRSVGDNRAYATVTAIDLLSGGPSDA